MGRMVREGTEAHPGSLTIIPLSELQTGIYLIWIKTDGKYDQGIPFMKVK